MESELFQRRRILFENLEKFGFIRSKEGYIIERKIYEGMIARVHVSLIGEVTGEVFDEDFREPYTLYRQPDAEGAFVVGVRNAYLAFLSEIATAVSIEKRYISDQANRIDRAIYEKYSVNAEYLWKKFPHFGVYRNPSSGKWFGIIMNISKDKVVSGEDGEGEVMNVKADDMTEKYLREGAYPCYHMNQKNWVTLILDDRISDEMIMEMVDASYRNTEKKGK